MPICAMVGCSKTYRPDEGVRLFSLPKVIATQCQKTQELSSKRRATWLSRINRNMTGKKVEGITVKVCDRHFITGAPSALFDFTHPDWAPTLNLGYEWKKGCEASVSRYVRTQERRRKKSAIPPSILHQGNASHGSDDVNSNQQVEVEQSPYQQREDISRARRRSHMKHQVLMEKRTRDVQLDHNETHSRNTPGKSARITGQIHTSDEVTCIKEELVDDAIVDYYKMINEELPANDVKIVQDPLSISSDIKEETPIPMKTGSSARISGQTIHTSDDVTCIKEELVDDTIADYNQMIKEELPANEVKIVQDPLSISSDIKEETPIPTQTGSHVGLPATDPPTVATDVKEEWIDDVTWEDIEDDDVTNSVREVFAVKEENDVISRQIDVFVEGDQAGPSEDVMIDFENLVDIAHTESGGEQCITLKKNKICDLRKTYSCYNCAYISESKAELRRHIAIHFEVKPCECDVRGSKFLKTHDLQRHQMTHTRKMQYACNVCKSRFSQSSSLKSHMLTHSREKPYACDVCESRFTQSSHLKSHMLTHSGEKPYACDVCESRFTWSISLKSHMLSHSGEKPYACEVCESRFTWSISLKSHMLSHSGEKPYACDVCESRFTQSSHLKSHMLTHSGEKPYACDVCESRFTQSSHLKRHMLTHSGEKPYACGVCESRFTRSGHLKRHMLTHSGEKPYACDVCESRFTRSGYLKMHMMTHTGEKLYAFDVCESRFIRSGHLKRHMLTHTGEKRYA